MGTDEGIREGGMDGGVVLLGLGVAGVQEQLNVCSVRELPVQTIA